MKKTSKLNLKRSYENNFTNNYENNFITIMKRNKFEKIVSCKNMNKKTQRN